MQRALANQSTQFYHAVNVVSLEEEFVEMVRGASRSKEWYVLARDILHRLGWTSNSWESDQWRWAILRCVWQILFLWWVEVDSRKGCDGDGSSLGYTCDGTHFDCVVVCVIQVRFEPLWWCSDDRLGRWVTHRTNVLVWCECKCWWLMWWMEKSGSG